MQHITVVGAGTMGNGIAHVFAQYGRDVTLVDISADALERAHKKVSANLGRQVAKERLTAADAAAALARIRTTTVLAEAASGADLVVEVASENEDIKRQLFAELDAVAPARPC